MRPKDRKLTRRLFEQAQRPRPLPEIVLSPNLGAPIARPPAALLPPVICFDPWRDFAESLYPLRLVIGQRLSKTQT